MTLVDKIEQLGAAAAGGELSAEEAAHELQLYTDGDLTRVGALDALASWRSVRAQVADTMMSAELGLAAAKAAPGEDDVTTLIEFPTGASGLVSHALSGGSESTDSSASRSSSW